MTHSRYRCTWPRQYMQWASPLFSCPSLPKTKVVVLETRSGVCVSWRVVLASYCEPEESFCWVQLVCGGSLKSSATQEQIAILEGTDTHIGLWYSCMGNGYITLLFYCYTYVNIFASSLSHSGLNCTSRADVTPSGDHGRNHCSRSERPARLSNHASSFTNPSSRSSRQLSAVRRPCKEPQASTRKPRTRTSRTPSDSNRSTHVRENWSSPLVGEPKVSAVKIGSNSKGGEN